MNDLTGIGKILLLTGLGLAALGGLLWWGGRILGLGRLSGDILIRRGSFTLYLPLATGLLLSIVLSIILSLGRKH